MPWYHIKIEWEHEYDGRQYRKDVNFEEEQVKKLTDRIKQGLSILFLGINIDSSTIKIIEIWKTSGTASNTQSHWDYIKSKGENVTKEFINYIPDKQNKNIENATRVSKKSKTTNSKNIFIVHGRDFEPVKELKIMLLEFGLNPIVLHEQPSGSRTIVEKLEKYSDVGYAFVILTPDDLGALRSNIIDRPQTFVRRSFLTMLNLKPRARQNVVLEFGYFIGLLDRDRVCCLLKGDVEKPSDMDGIVYVPFKDSVKERRNMIIKELKEAGYELEG